MLGKRPVVSEGKLCSKCLLSFIGIQLLSLQKRLQICIELQDEHSIAVSLIISILQQAMSHGPRI